MCSKNVPQIHGSWPRRLLVFPHTVLPAFFVLWNHHIVEKSSLKNLKMAITVFFFFFQLCQRRILLSNLLHDPQQARHDQLVDHWIARYASRRRRRRCPVVAQQSCVWERKKSNKCEDILYLTTYNLGAITTDLKSANYVKLILHKYKSLED